MASSIPIRNQKEFETLSSQLYDPSLSDDAREGVLNAMERIIGNSLNQFQSGEETDISRGISSTQKPSKERPPLSSFNR